MNEESLLIDRFTNHYRLLFRLALIFYLLLLLLAATLPVPQAGAAVFFSLDHIIHGFLYGILSVFFFHALHTKPKACKPFPAFTAAVLLASAYGALLESVQYLLPYRFFDLRDFAANCLGALFFGVAAWLSTYFFKLPLCK